MISVWGGNKRVYKSNNYYDLQIVLYFIQGENDHWAHFTVITKINALLSKSYYCKDCDKSFNNIKSHWCNVWCNICGRSKCISSKETIVCQSCNALCRLLSCLQAHTIKRGKLTSSMCEQLLFCPFCKVTLHHYRAKGWGLEMHMCGESYCTNCAKYYRSEEEVHWSHIGCFSLYLWKVC